MFKKILIANRGEVAVRILRTCKDMGIHTVAVHSDVDTDAMHVRLADESVCIGPASAKQSYLNAHAILSAGAITGADAIHPGFGFLSENAAFAKMVEEHGFSFIGPSHEHIALMGNKIEARKKMSELGFNIVPGSGEINLENINDIYEIANQIGFPVIIKSAGGGGGKGIKIAYDVNSLTELLEIAKAEAKAAFGNDKLYVEKYLENPKHIELQILGDKFNKAIHLGERDCSVQRRYQKVLEEAPSTVLTKKQRNEIGSKAEKIISDIGYHSLGTIEFLYSDGRFYFMEMNTRLQVEHPVTEMITGVDLVREQILVAANEPLSISSVNFSGHAIECRITAESATSFAPSPGTIKEYHAPGGPGVRVDSALYTGAKVPPHYDSLIAKLVVHGQNRHQCLARLKRALEEYVIGGVETLIPLHIKLVESNEVIQGNYSINFLEKFLQSSNLRKEQAA